MICYSPRYEQDKKEERTSKIPTPNADSASCFATNFLHKSNLMDELFCLKIIGCLSLLFKVAENRSSSHILTIHIGGRRTVAMSVPSLENFAKGALATVATVSAIGVGLLYYGQGYLIYPSAFPPGARTEVPRPTDYGLPYEDLPLKTPDGVTLGCYLLSLRRSLAATHSDYIKPEAVANYETDEEFAASRPTVVMFHGNAGNHGHRIPLARVFLLNMRCNVLMVSYRGYGLSEGSPSERGLCVDAQTALDYLTSHPIFSKNKIILYGQSIGGAVAIDLASRNTDKISALVLENTFTSLPKLVPHALPMLGPLAFLCHQKWDSLSKIPLIPPTTPILMLSGAKDELVPKEHMRILWEAIAKRGAKKTEGGSEYKTGLERAAYKEFAEGNHNDTCIQPGYWQSVIEFVGDVIKTKS